MKFSGIFLLPVVALCCSFALSNDHAVQPYLQFSDSPWQKTWSHRNTLVNLITAEPETLHPTNGTSSSRAWILSLTQNYLVRIDNTTGQLAPDLLTELPTASTDAKKYSFRLRKDAQWDDGKPVTAADVVFTLKANKCPLTDNSAAKFLFTNVADVETNPKDPLAFSIIMKSPSWRNVSFLTDMPVLQKSFFDPQNLLEEITFGALDSSARFLQGNEKVLTWSLGFNNAKNGTDITKMNGCGAYKISEWKSGKFITLIKKQDHWSEKIKNPRSFETAFSDTIIFKLEASESMQQLLLEQQQMDCSAWLSTAFVNKIAADTVITHNYNIGYVKNYSYNYIGMNMRPDGTMHKKFFNDKNVRRAMAYLIPVDEMITAITGGHATRQISNVSPLKSECNNSLEPIPFLPDSAIQILTAAGWKDTDGDGILDKMIDGNKVPFQIEFMYQEGAPMGEEMVNVFQKSFALAKIKLIKNPVPVSAMIDYVKRHNFDMYLSAWSSFAGDEDFSQLWHTSSIVGGSNFCSFGNKESDALIDEMNLETDPVKRAALSKKLQQIIYDEHPYIFLYSIDKKILIHKRYTNAICTYNRPGLILNNLKVND